MEKETCLRLEREAHAATWEPPVKHVGPWKLQQPKRRLVYVEVVDGNETRTKADCDWVASHKEPGHASA